MSGGSFSGLRHKPAVTKALAEASKAIREGDTESFYEGLVAIKAVMKAVTKAADDLRGKLEDNKYSAKEVGVVFHAPTELQSAGTIIRRVGIRYDLAST
jgi:hypothetical protein